MSFLNILKDKIFIKNNFFPLILVVIIFFIDRISKNKIIEHHMNGSNMFVNDYLNYILVWNTGIGFGLFSLDANIFYHILTTVIFFILIVLVYLIIKSKIVDKIFFSLILGGALGNFCDRAIYFAVPDFIDIHYNDYHWFTFNIADIFITLGIILIIIQDLLLKKK